VLAGDAALPRLPARPSRGRRGLLPAQARAGGAASVGPGRVHGRQGSLRQGHPRQGRGAAVV